MISKRRYIDLKKIKSIFMILIVNILVLFIDVYLYTKKMYNKISDYIYIIYKKKSLLIGFIIYIFKLIIIVLFIYFILIYYKIDEDLINLILNSVVFIFSTLNILKLLKMERKLSYDGNGSIKKLYLLFGLFYSVCIVLSFIEKYKLSSEINRFYILDNFKYMNITLDGLSITIWNVINSIKESMLTAIIFDTAYQMYNYNLKDSQIKYIQEVCNSRRLYIFKKDKENKNLKVWYMRTEQCADIIDYCSQYNIIENTHINIEYNTKQAKEIIEKRKKSFPQDDYSEFYNDEKDEIDYYFYFTFLDFSELETINFTRREIFDLIENSLIELPSDIKYTVYENSIKKLRKKLIRSKVNITNEMLSM